MEWDLDYAHGCRCSGRATPCTAGPIASSGWPAYAARAAGFVAGDVLIGSEESPGLQVTTVIRLDHVGAQQVLATTLAERRTRANGGTKDRIGHSYEVERTWSLSCRCWDRARRVTP
jgi:hypothetical protein